MLPPEAPEVDTVIQGASPPAGSRFLRVLKNRSDFLKAARSVRQSTPGLILQARHRSIDAKDGVRVGFTCSKKVGNAVTRNRAKRRLRAVATQILPDFGRDGWDYVLIGRSGGTVDRPFTKLQSDLRSALLKMHGPG